MVEYLIKDSKIHDFYVQFSEIGDLERMCSRLAVLKQHQGHQSVKKSLKLIVILKELLSISVNNLIIG